MNTRQINTTSPRLIDLTVEDLHRLLDERDRMLEERLRQMMSEDLPSHVRGIKGIAQIYHCSIPTAQRIKNSGKIDCAITQVGRTIVVDTRAALAAYRN